MIGYSTLQRKRGRDSDLGRRRKHFFFGTNLSEGFNAAGEEALKKR